MATQILVVEVASTTRLSGTHDSRALHSVNRDRPSGIRPWGPSSAGKGLPNSGSDHNCIWTQHGRGHKSYTFETTKTSPISNMNTPDGRGFSASGVLSSHWSLLRKTYSVYALPSPRGIKRSSSNQHTYTRTPGKPSIIDYKFCFIHITRFVWPVWSVNEYMKWDVWYLI